MALDTLKLKPMIYWPELQLVFIRPYRVGSSTTIELITRNTGISPEILGPDDYPLLNSSHGHSIAKGILDTPELVQICKECLVFTQHRNPFTWVVSLYHHLIQSFKEEREWTKTKYATLREECSGDIDNFVAIRYHNHQQGSDRSFSHLWGNHELVDEFIPLEDRGPGLSKVFKHIGVEWRSEYLDPVVNGLDYDRNKDWYSTESRERIKVMYAEDFKRYYPDEL